MKTPSLSILFLGLALLSPALAEEPKLEVLFDGSGLDGWEQAGNWEIQDDGSVFRKERGGSLIYKTKKVPDDFELRFEWKVGEKSNSGLYYRPGQYEYQILANKGHGNGTNPRTTAASLYFCMAPSHDATKEPGEWNSGRVVCKGSFIQHWLNGEKVIAFDYEDPRWADAVALLKARGGNLEARGAYLSLQDHGDPVWFRNIQMREIPADEEIDSTQVTPAEIPAEELAAEQAKIESILKKRKEAEEKAKKEEKQ